MNPMIDYEGWWWWWWSPTLRATERASEIRVWRDKLNLDAVGILLLFFFFFFFLFSQTDNNDPCIVSYEIQTQFPLLTKYSTHARRKWKRNGCQILSKNIYKYITSFKGLTVETVWLSVLTPHFFSWYSLQCARLRETVISCISNLTSSPVLPLGFYHFGVGVYDPIATFSLAACHPLWLTQMHNCYVFSTSLSLYAILHHQFINIFLWVLTCRLWTRFSILSRERERASLVLTSS